MYFASSDDLAVQKCRPRPRSPPTDSSPRVARDNYRKRSSLFLPAYAQFRRRSIIKQSNVGRKTPNAREEVRFSARIQTISRHLGSKPAKRKDRFLLNEKLPCSRRHANEASEEHARGEFGHSSASHRLSHIWIG